MRVVATSPVSMKIDRTKSAALVLARADVWSAASSGWKFEGAALLQDVAKSVQSEGIALGAGDYRVVFTCRIEETRNGGAFGYEFFAQTTEVFFDDGNVDSTASGSDARAYKAEFDLTVQ
ncbi:MAG: hypothetical protein ACJ8IK_28705 [Burkholderiaceae bacterium]|jgi:hypothetical protein